MPERLLELKGVSMSFGSLVVVSQLDLHVDEGEIVSVIGPNGAGKTTLFNLVTGVYEPVDGDIVFAGESIVGLDPHRRPLVPRERVVMAPLGGQRRRTAIAPAEDDRRQAPGGHRDRSGRARTRRRSGDVRGRGDMRAV